MFEKVNPSHPDKVADRIAGALVDLAYSRQEDPRVAVEVLIGHGHCFITAESSVVFDEADVDAIVERIAGSGLILTLVQVPQDGHLADNQAGGMRCGDNGIFRGVPVTDEQAYLTEMAHWIHGAFPTDGKYLVDHGELTICQSNATEQDILAMAPGAYVNPLGEWTGGVDVDSGATNRKLGSDMGDSVTGGGLHGKDLSKADVTLNIWAFMKAQRLRRTVEISCAIGDEMVDGVPYGDLVEFARAFIKTVGGFEKFAEWGLIR